jgi:hypothetical protein
MTLFHFVSLCPILNLATLLHLWWRNIQAQWRLTKCSHCIAFDRFRLTHPAILPDREDYSFLGFHADVKQRFPQVSTDRGDIIFKAYLGPPDTDDYGSTFETSGRVIYVDQHVHIIKFQVIHKFGPPTRVATKSPYRWEINTKEYTILTHRFHICNVKIHKIYNLYERAGINTIIWILCLVWY